MFDNVTLIVETDARQLEVYNIDLEKVKEIKIEDYQYNFNILFSPFKTNDYIVFKLIYDNERSYYLIKTDKIVINKNMYMNGMTEFKDVKDIIYYEQIGNKTKIKFKRDNYALVYIKSDKLFFLNEVELKNFSIELYNGDYEIKVFILYGDFIKEIYQGSITIKNFGVMENEVS